MLLGLFQATTYLLFSFFKNISCDVIDFVTNPVIRKYTTCLMRRSELQDYPLSVVHSCSVRVHLSILPIASTVNGHVWKCWQRFIHSFWSRLGIELRTRYCMPKLYGLLVSPTNRKIVNVVIWQVCVRPIQANFLTERVYSCKIFYH